jgi:hypothetical protein
MVPDPVLVFRLRHNAVTVVPRVSAGESAPIERRIASNDGRNDGGQEAAAARQGGEPEEGPDDWTTGDEPMTSSRASDLETLCKETGDSETVDTGLSKAEAFERIDRMRKRAGPR